MKTQEEVYKNFMPLIKSKAIQMSRKTGIEYQELFAQANLIFCENYNKGFKINNICLEMYLSHYVRQYHRQIHPNMDQSNKIFTFYDTNYKFNEFFNSISADARNIITTIMTKPEEIIKTKLKYTPDWQARKGELSITTLKLYMNKELKWSSKKIEEITREIKKEIQSIF